MRWRDREEEAWEQKEGARHFQKNTLWLRKYYKSLPLLRMEIRQLEEEKNKLYEAAYTTTDWGEVRVDGGQISDPTFQAVTRLRELEERHFWSSYTLKTLEWARDQLKPEDKQLFDGYILEGKSLSEISRRTGLSWDKVKRRLVQVCEKMVNRLTLFLREDCE